MLPGIWTTVAAPPMSFDHSQDPGRRRCTRHRAAHAEGSVALAAGDTATARRQLTAALEWWRKVPAPYDEANSLVVLALAEESATRAMHLETALESFSRLGAVAEVQRVMALLGRHQEADRVTLAMMFTDIEGSTTLLTQLGDTEWLKVLRHHDSILRELFERHGGEILTGTGDGFFVGFPTPDAGLDCALDIQRAKQDVRVRVGVHYAEASRDHGGFSGRGVHEAARISALGCGGDIVVSAATLGAHNEALPDARCADRRLEGTARRDADRIPGGC